MTSTVDLTGEAFALRLANLLRHHRQESGLRLRALARRSEGRFTVRELRDFEAGHGPAVDSAEVAALYGADLSTILPARLPLEIRDGTIATAGVSEPFPPGDDTSLLTAYLLLIRRLRDQQRAEVIVLRRDDVGVLASTLDLPGEVVVDRLGALMEATRVQRRIMVGLFIAGAVIVGVAATTVAATAGDSPSPASPTDAPVAVTAPDPTTTAPTTTTPAPTTTTTAPTTTTPAPTTTVAPSTTLAPTTTAPPTTTPPTTTPPTTTVVVAVGPPPVPTTSAPIAPAPPATEPVTEPLEIEVGPPPIPPPPPAPITPTQSTPDPSPDELAVVGVSETDGNGGVR